MPFFLYNGSVPVAGYQGACPASRNPRRLSNRVHQGRWRRSPRRRLSRSSVAAADDMFGEGAAQRNAVGHLYCDLGSKTRDPWCLCVHNWVRAVTARCAGSGRTAIFEWRPVEIPKAHELEAAHAQLQTARTGGGCRPVARASGRG